MNVWCNSRDLIGLSAMIYEPLYHTEKQRPLNCLLFVLAKRNRWSSNISWLFLIKKIISLTLAGYEMIIANYATSAIYHLEHIQSALVE